MRVLLFFNELSCSVVLPKEQADETMRQFVGVLREITAQRGDTALVSEVKLKELEIAPGYYLEEWRRRPGNVDLWRWILRMRNRAPFSEVLPPGAGEGAEYFHAGRPAKALGAAHLMDGVLVSLLVDSVWDAPRIQAERTRLGDDPDGELIEDAVDVRHASTTAHVECHMEWLKQVGIPDLRHGSEIWAARGDLYPNLLFLPRTEPHFAGLRPDWVIPAAQELRRIDHAIADWDPARMRLPIWRSKVTADSASRKQQSLFDFEDFDGVIRTFDLHGRFTPGAGRVYFRLVPEQGKATIAHIGEHL